MTKTLGIARTTTLTSLLVRELPFMVNDRLPRYLILPAGRVATIPLSPETIPSGALFRHA